MSYGFKDCEVEPFMPDDSIEPLQRINVLASNIVPLPIELVAQHERLHERVLKMQLVNVAHKRRIDRADQSGQIVHAAAAGRFQDRPLIRISLVVVIAETESRREYSGYR